MPRDREQEQLKAIEEQIESDQVVQDGLSGDVHVAVEAGAITVTKPGTSYSVTYRKPVDSPHLVVNDPAKSSPQWPLDASRLFFFRLIEKSAASVQSLVRAVAAPARSLGPNIHCTSTSAEVSSVSSY
jgi:hypothetical protein